MAHADGITFVGETIPDGGITRHLVVGRVLANATWDVASYPPNGIVDVGAGGPIGATELADGSVVIIDPSIPVIRVMPDGTRDAAFAFAIDPATSSTRTVVGWGAHVVAGGTLTGGRAFVACR